MSAVLERRVNPVGTTNIERSRIEVPSATSVHDIINKTIKFRYEVGSDVQTVNGAAHGLSFSESLRKVTSELTLEQLDEATLPVRDQMDPKTIDRFERRVRAQVPIGRFSSGVVMNPLTGRDEYISQSVPRDQKEIEAEVARNVALRVIEHEARKTNPDQFTVNVPYKTERPFLYDVDGTPPGANSDSSFVDADKVKQFYKGN